MIDKDIIRRWWNVFVGDGGFTEVRILGKFQYSGYFKSVESLISAIEPYADMEGEQLYFTLNSVNQDCYGRQQCEKILKSPKMTTTDGDIVRRKWVLLDFDPLRATGVNSTDEELELAHQKAQAVFRYLRKEGFPDPVICRSGNGWHQLFKVDLPNDDATSEILKRFLQSLGKIFSDNKVEVDEKVFNAGRICKLYGTVAKKGANIPERPWRMSDIVYVPENIQTVDISLFQKIADLLPKEEPKVAPNRRPYQSQSQFDLRTWLSEHGIVYKEEQQGNSVRFTLEYCPWVDTHSDKKKWDSALFLDPDGKVTFNCTHSHCKDRTWHNFRLFYEPDAYSRPMYQPQPRMYGQQKPRYVIKEELPELGNKWLQMDEIEKVDLSSIPRVKTGITELDRFILGFAESEVTLISGGNAAGKTSLINSLILNFVEQGVPTALWSGELPPQILKAWIQMAAAGKNFLKPSQFGDGKYFVPSNIGKRIDDWLRGRFFLFNNEYGSTWEEILHDMKDLLAAGVKVFILDNLMSLDIDLLEGDKNNKQKELILQVKEFAKKNNVHVILVAHPRKSMAFLRKNDISGTSDLTNVVDNTLIIHRVNQDFLKAGAEFYGQAEIQRYSGYGNVIEIAKNRMYGVCDVLVGLHYEIESRRFKNAPDEVIHYGWEGGGEQTDFWNEQNETTVYEEGQQEIPFGVYSGEDAPPF